MGLLLREGEGRRREERGEREESGKGRMEWEGRGRKRREWERKWRDEGRRGDSNPPYTCLGYRAIYI